MSARSRVHHRSSIAALATLLSLATIAAAQDEADTPTAEELAESEIGEFEDPLGFDGSVKLAEARQGVQLKIVVHRWSPPSEEEATETQEFDISLEAQPSFIQNISWPSGSRLSFEPDEATKSLPLQFDVAPVTGTGNGLDTELVLLVRARGADVVPPQRRIVILIEPPPVLADPVVAACALAEEAPEEFPPAEAASHCEESIDSILPYDRIAVFFTPRRDLKTGASEHSERTPETTIADESNKAGAAQRFDANLGSINGFFWELLNPDGDPVYRASWTPGADREEEQGGPRARPNSPGEFVFLPDLWGPLPPNHVATTPGTYTLRTAGLKFEDAGILGGGTPSYLPDEQWQTEGTFEVADPTLHFQGFVTEPTEPHSFTFSGLNPVSGNLEPSGAQVQGTTVTLDLNARWNLGREMQRAQSRLVLEFPETIDPGSKELFEVKGGLQLITNGRTSTNAAQGFNPLAFVAGLHLLVPTNQLPPDRYLIRGKDGPAPLAATYRFVPPSRETWVLFNRGSTSLSKVRSSYQSTAVFSQPMGFKTESVGSPSRRLPWHLRDPQTIWVVPVFSQLVEQGRAYDSAVAPGSTSFYGYAIYGPGQDQYAGPNPAGDPVEPALNLRLDSEQELSEEQPGGGQDQVPDLAGTTVAEATAALRERGLNPRIVAGPPAPSPDQAGRVASVSPSPGTPVIPNQDVTITVFADPVAVATVPSLRGVPRPSSEELCETYRGMARMATNEQVRASALRLLRGMGCSVPLASISPPAQETEAFPPPDDPRFDPRAREQDRILDPTARQQSPSGKVPRVVDLEAKQAKEAIESQGYTMDVEVGPPARRETDAYRVSRQQPAAGSLLARGGAVKITIWDRWSAPRHVPNVVGSSAADAKATLDALGLKAQVSVGRPASRHEDSFVVAKQSPVAGSTAAVGDTVHIELFGEFQVAEVEPSRPRPPQPPTRPTAPGVVELRIPAGLWTVDNGLAGGSADIQIDRDGVDWRMRFEDRGAHARTDAPDSRHAVLYLYGQGPNSRYAAVVNIFWDVGDLRTCPVGRKWTVRYEQNNLIVGRSGLAGYLTSDRAVAWIGVNGRTYEEDMNKYIRPLAEHVLQQIEPYAAPCQ